MHVGSNAADKYNKATFLANHMKNSADNLKISRRYKTKFSAPLDFLL
jgi:hypothetical protein